MNLNRSTIIKCRSIYEKCGWIANNNSDNNDDNFRIENNILEWQLDFEAEKFLTDVQQFDVVLSSDAVFNLKTARPFATTLSRFCKKFLSKNGFVLLAHKHRHERVDEILIKVCTQTATTYLKSLSTVQKQWLKNDFKIETIPSFKQHFKFDGKDVNVSIYKLTLIRKQ